VRASIRIAMVCVVPGPPSPNCMPGWRRTCSTHSPTVEYGASAGTSRKLGDSA
jgi:hypothetical protein